MTVQIFKSAQTNELCNLPANRQKKRRAGNYHHIAIEQTTNQIHRVRQTLNKTKNKTKNSYQQKTNKKTNTSPAL